MTPFRRALVVGKFSPLHRGHESLIETAKHGSFDLHVFSWSQPEYAGCDAFTRWRWLTRRFPMIRFHVLGPELLYSPLGDEKHHLKIPANNAADLEQSHFCASLWGRLINAPLDAVYSAEPDGDRFVADINAFFTSKTRLPGNARHIAVPRDPATASSAAIRTNVYQHRALLSPHVYRSFVKTVCFVGALWLGKNDGREQNGRTLPLAGYNGAGRAKFIASDLSAEALLHIAEEQIAAEDAALHDARDFLFVDSTPLTILVHSELTRGKAEERLVRLSLRPYDHLFLCAPLTPLQKREHELHQALLAERKMAHTLLTGTLDERVKKVIQQLEGR